MDKVHSGRKALQMVSFTAALERRHERVASLDQRGVVRPYGVRRDVAGCGIEWRRDRIGCRVVLAQRWNAEQLFHRLQHAVRVVECVVDRVRFDPGTDDEAGRPVGIHVIRAILGIVLNHKDRGARPHFTVAEQIHRLTDGIVVVGDIGVEPFDV